MDSLEAPRASSSLSELTFQRNFPFFILLFLGILLLLLPGTFIFLGYFGLFFCYLFFWASSSWVSSSS